MSKDILVIASSPRKGGNSETLADEFIKGAEAAGNNVEKISLADKTISFCKGCLVCQKTGHCVIHDDAELIAQKILTHEVIVFATPVYFYGMCGQMKTMLDRTNPLFPAEYAFRDIYLIATSADDSENAMDGTIKGLQGWIDCFEKTTLKGMVCGLGVDEYGAVLKMPELLQEAYNLGKAIQ